MKIDPIAVPAELAELELVYKAAGHRLYLVGGVVRDHILKLDSKDTDLATDATPDEQIALLEAAGYRWFGTGLQHGTITMLAGGEAYEITTFRTDVETDGRHAVVAYTRDLPTDLARRDLTFNAIAMTLSGEIVDPFGGVEDALAKRVRFVGVADERIREDYLRIMRWFRFLGRFGADLDTETVDAVAVRDNAAGLARISVERIWSEMQRILSGPRPAGIVDMMKALGVLDVLSLKGDADRLADMRAITPDPLLLLAAWLGTDAQKVANVWNMSNAERDAVRFSSDRLSGTYDLTQAKLDLVDRIDPKWVDAVLRLQGRRDAVRTLSHWEVPAFPVTGQDLVDAGMAPGKAVGVRMKAMRAKWIASDYAMTMDELMAMETADV